MKRILMRAGKSPMEALSAHATFGRNAIGGNNGNLIFGAAAHKLFSTQGTDVVPNHYRISGDMADKVNSEYDGFVLPLANAFRLGFEGELRRTTEFIEGLKIPFVMVSGGAQLGLDGGYDSLKPMEDAVKAFARAVLSKSSALSVRGEATAAYLHSLGFKDVVVVGCPSMTMNGPGHRVDSAIGTLSRGSKVAYNVETSIDILAKTISNSSEMFDLTYFPQDIKTMEMMLWGVDRYPSTRDKRLPLRSEHEQFRSGAAEFHLDASSWIDRMRAFSLSFGPRIHGNIAAILAGTPAVVFAHDSRTLELADYHQIPLIHRDEESKFHDVGDIYNHADYTSFNNGHVERFNRLSGFLSENGFATIYDEGQETARASYEKRLLEISFPEALRPLSSEMSDFERSRLQWERESYLEQQKVQLKLRRDLNAAVLRIKKLESQNSRLRDSYSMNS